MVDDGVYDGVDPLSAPDIAEGRGRIPLPSISSPASPLVTRNIFVLMPAGRARSRASTSCQSTAATKEGWARASHSRDGSRRPRTRHGENVPSLLRLGWLQCRLSGVATVGESSGGVSLVDWNQRYPTLAIRIRIQTERRAADSQKLYR